MWFCRWREQEGSTAWRRTDGYCHTLHCRPERCAVKLLQESIDEGQLPAWKPCKRKLPYYHASVTEWLSVAAHMLACCIQNTVYIIHILKWISTCNNVIRLLHTLNHSVSNLMRPLPYIQLETVGSTTVGGHALVHMHHIYSIHALKSLEYVCVFWWLFFRVF